MKHVLSWLLTAVVIAAISALIWALLDHGGIYAAFVPWALAASLGLLFWLVSARPESEPISQRVLALIVAEQDVRTKVILKHMQTGDLALVRARFAPNSNLLPQVLGARDTLQNGSAGAKFLRISPTVAR